MKYYLFLLISFLPNFCFGQSEITVEGSILDAENGEPISYAHIGIPAEHIGTASGLNGIFRLTFSRDHKKDTLQVSAIGYHTKKISLSSIVGSKPVNLRLQPKTYQMKSITVTDAEPETKWIGKKIRPVLSASYGRNIGHKKIGAAYAFRIKWGGPLPVKLLQARMFLKRNENDELRMRCRIADVDTTTNFPGDDITEKSIITTSEKDKGWITCDIRKHDIYVNKRNFFLVFEWLPNKEQTYTPMFAVGFSFDSEVYDRTHVMGKWRKNPNDLVYSLKVEY